MPISAHYNISMLVLMGNEPQFIINTEPLDEVLRWDSMSAQKYCEINKLDYQLFKKVYNNDLTITIEELIMVAQAFGLSLREFVVVV